MIKEINFDNVEFGEPIEKKEPSYRDGYIRGIYRARNIIDSKQKEIERLNNIIDKAKEKSIYLQERYGYILDDLTFMLMQGSDKE